MNAVARTGGDGLLSRPSLSSFQLVFMPPILKTQEIPYDDPESCNYFRPGPDKPFVATAAAIAEYQQEIILKCLFVLQEMAEKYDGLDYLQVFQDIDKKTDLWFIEDGNGGAITALLPSDY